MMKRFWCMALTLSLVCMPFSSEAMYSNRQTSGLSSLWIACAVVSTVAGGWLIYKLSGRSRVKVKVASRPKQSPKTTIPESIVDDIPRVEPEKVPHDVIFESASIQKNNASSSNKEQLQSAAVQVKNTEQSAVSISQKTMEIPPVTQAACSQSSEQPVQNTPEQEARYKALLEELAKAPRKDLVAKIIQMHLDAQQKERELSAELAAAAQLKQESTSQSSSSHEIERKKDAANAENLGQAELEEFDNEKLAAIKKKLEGEDRARRDAKAVILKNPLGEKAKELLEALPKYDQRNAEQRYTIELIDRAKDRKELTQFYNAQKKLGSAQRTQ